MLERISARVPVKGSGAVQSMASRNGPGKDGLTSAHRHGEVRGVARGHRASGVTA